MKFLEYLEKAWIGAAIAAVVVTIYNLVSLRTFDNRIYFPAFCAAFCILIWMNIRSQRRFREKMDSKNEKQPNK